MAQQITHRREPETGRMIQIVTPAELRKILRRNGDSFERPRDFRADDEWRV